MSTETETLEDRFDRAREVLSALVYWHDRGKEPDESWWQAAREIIAPYNKGTKP